MSDRIDLFVDGPGRERVEVQVIERRGEIEVALRANSPQTVERIRESLPDLTDRLHASGFDASAWSAEDQSKPGKVAAEPPIAQELNWTRDQQQQRHEPQPDETPSPHPQEGEDSFEELMSAGDISK
jgi:hypothetical protein